MGGSYSNYEENSKGKLQPGYYADFVVLSQDLFTIQPSAIHATRVLLTVMDGKITYRQKDWK
jgi:predicted amidohydrolase YtcJ